jgi:hypothetical protein
MSSAVSKNSSRPRRYLRIDFPVRTQRRRRRRFLHRPTHRCHRHPLGMLCPTLVAYRHLDTSCRRRWGAVGKTTVSILAAGIRGPGECARIDVVHCPWEPGLAEGRAAGLRRSFALPQRIFWSQGTRVETAPGECARMDVVHCPWEPGLAEGRAAGPRRSFALPFLFFLEAELRQSKISAAGGPAP